MGLKSSTCTRSYPGTIKIRAIPVSLFPLNFHFTSMQASLIWIFYTLMFLQFITLIYGIQHYSRLNTPLKIITSLVGVSLAVGIIGTILPRLGYYSTPVINLYHLIEVSILYLFFYYIDPRYISLN